MKKDFEIYFNDLTEECQERLRKTGLYYGNIDLKPVAIIKLNDDWNKRKGYNIMTNLFSLAGRQLEWEVRSKQRKEFTLIDVIEYSVMVRRHMDFQERGMAILKSKNRKKK